MSSAVVRSHAAPSASTARSTITRSPTSGFYTASSYLNVASRLMPVKGAWLAGGPTKALHIQACLQSHTFQNSCRRPTRAWEHEQRQATALQNRNLRAWLLLAEDLRDEALTFNGSSSVCCSVFIEVLDARRGAFGNIWAAEPSRTCKHLKMGRVGLVSEASAGDPHDAVEDAHLCGVILVFTQPASQLDLGRFLHCRIRVVEAGRRSQRRKIVPMDDG